MNASIFNSFIIISTVFRSITVMAAEAHVVEFKNWKLTYYKDAVNHVSQYAENIWSVNPPVMLNYENNIGDIKRLSVRVQAVEKDCTTDTKSVGTFILNNGKIRVNLYENHFKDVNDTVSNIYAIFRSTAKPCLKLYFYNLNNDEIEIGFKNKLGSSIYMEIINSVRLFNVNE